MLQYRIESYLLKASMREFEGGVSDGEMYVDISKPVHKKNVRVGHELSVRQALTAENIDDSSKCQL